MNMANIAQQLQQPARPMMRALGSGMSGPQQAQGYNGVLDPATGLPYQFGNGAGAGTYNPTAAGSDWIMNGDPTQGTGGDAGNGAGVTDYLHNATAIGDLGSTIQGLGYTGNIIDQGTGGDSGSASSVDPAVIQWLQQQGYNIGARPDNTDTSGGSNYYGLFKGNQALADPTNVKSDDGTFGAAMAAAAAFATAGASGAFSGAADAGANAGLSGMDIAADGGANSIYNPAWTGAGGAPGSSAGLDFGGGGDAPETGGGSGGANYSDYGQATGQGAPGSSLSTGAPGSSTADSSLYSDYAPTSGAGVGSPGQSLSTSQGTSGFTAGSTSDPFAGGSSGGLGSSLQNALTTTGADGSINGVSQLGKGLIGLGAGALSGSGSGLSGLFGGGDTSQLNSVNYQNAATAQGQSARTNQTNAQGSLTYNQNGVDAQGNPTYSQDVKLNAPYQQNLNQALGNQSTALGNLQNYNSGLSAAYAGAPSLYGNAGSQADLVKQAQDAAYNSQTSYLDPQYAQQQKQLSAQLANQGVSYGSDAYNAAMTQFGSQQNQAYGTARDSAISQGDQYANTLFNQNLAANQQYNTNLNNQGTNYQNLSGNALTGVTQNPTFASAPPATNYLGAAQLQGNANLNQYNAKTGNANNTQAGLTGIGTALLGNQNVWNGISNLFGGGP